MYEIVRVYEYIYIYIHIYIIIWSLDMIDQGHAMGIVLYYIHNSFASL